MAEQSDASSRVPNSSMGQQGSKSISHYAQSGIHSCALNVSSTCPSWIIDTGASEHMTGSSNLFTSYTPCSGKDKVRVADGSLSPISGRGSVVCTPLLTLSSVLHIPSFTVNLLSIQRLTESLHCSVTFFPTHCIFQDLVTGQKIGSGSAVGGLYYLDVPTSNMPLITDGTATQALQSIFESNLTSLHQWHRRLGHPPLSILGSLFPSLVKQCPKTPFLCEPCELGKHKRSTYSAINSRHSEPFAIIHTDVWGPSRVVSRSGHRWFVSFIDCHSRVTWIYLLRSKNEVFDCFQDFHKMIQTQFNAKVKILHSDNGREYSNNHVFESYLSQHGIILQTSCVTTPEQNGVAERKNRHLLEVARTLMFTMTTPKFLWGDAVLTAAFLINRLPSRILGNKSPISFLQHITSPSPSPRVFGCVCYVVTS